MPLAIQYYQPGDYDNTILRKLLLNQVYAIINGGGGGGGTPGGVSGSLQYNNAGSFGGYVPGTGIVTWLQTPSSANLLAAQTDKTGTGLLVFDTAPTLAGPTLTGTTTVATANATNLSATNFTFNSVSVTGPTGTGNMVLSTAPTISTIELGNASDTTLSRSSAGVLAVEGVVIPSVSSTNTLTNKRNTARITSINIPGATPTINTDNCDCVTLTAVGTAITSMTTNLSGTPVNFDQLEFRIKDDGTARAITWGASFLAGPAALPTTTILSKALHVYFEWDSVRSGWVCLSTGSDA